MEERGTQTSLILYFKQTRFIASITYRPATVVIQLKGSSDKKLTNKKIPGPKTSQNSKRQQFQTLESCLCRQHIIITDMLLT